jgi:hypothetical protein
VKARAYSEEYLPAFRKFILEQWISGSVDLVIPPEGSRSGAIFGVYLSQAITHQLNNKQAHPV